MKFVGANFDLKDDGTADIQLNLNNLGQCLWVFIRIVEEVESRHGSDRIHQMMVKPTAILRRVTPRGSRTKTCYMTFSKAEAPQANLRRIGRPRTGSWCALRKKTKTWRLTRGAAGRTR